MRLSLIVVLGLTAPSVAQTAPDAKAAPAVATPGESTMELEAHVESLQKRSLACAALAPKDAETAKDLVDHLRAQRRYDGGDLDFDGFVARAGGCDASLAAPPREKPAAGSSEQVSLVGSGTATLAPARCPLLRLAVFQPRKFTGASGAWTLDGVVAPERSLDDARSLPSLPIVLRAGDRTRELLTRAARAGEALKACYERLASLGASDLPGLLARADVAGSNDARLVRQTLGFFLEEGAVAATAAQGWTWEKTGGRSATITVAPALAGNDFARALADRFGPKGLRIQTETKDDRLAVRVDLQDGVDPAAGLPAWIGAGIDSDLPGVAKGEKVDGLIAHGREMVARTSWLAAIAADLDNVKKLREQAVAASASEYPQHKSDELRRKLDDCGKVALRPWDARTRSLDFRLAATEPLVRGTNPLACARQKVPAIRARALHVDTKAWNVDLAQPPPPKPTVAAKALAAPGAPKPVGREGPASKHLRTRIAELEAIYDEAEKKLAGASAGDLVAMHDDLDDAREDRATSAALELLLTLAAADATPPVEKLDAENGKVTISPVDAGDRVATALRGLGCEAKEELRARGELRLKLRCGAPR